MSDVAEKRLLRRDWEEAGESEADFYRRALAEILDWQDLALAVNPWPGNVLYGLRSVTETAKSALLGIEFDTERRIAKLQQIMALAETGTEVR